MLRGIAASIFSVANEVGRASSLPGMPPPAPNGALQMGLRSFFPHGLSDLPRVASLWALAAVALPGVGGLVFLTLAGVRIGYRQAKAGFALRAAGIARFARPGPLGVVRSGHWLRSSAGIARRPPGGVKRRISSQRRLAARRTRDSTVDSLADARVAVHRCDGLGAESEKWVGPVTQAG